MPRYLFKATYTHDDPKIDRRRHSFVIENDGGVMDMIDDAISTLEIGHMRDHIVSHYLEQICDEDTSEGWSWALCDNNGQWDLEWCPFEPEDTAL